jgi:hypothetical protein
MSKTSRVTRLRVLTLSVATIVNFAIAVLPAHAAAGFQAHSYAGFNAEGQGGAITGQKPESKLWYHNGSWWAAMLSPSQNGSHTIWKLVGTSWVDTGTLVDGRTSTKEDVLWTGTKLYIVSRSGTTASPNRLRRYTFNGSIFVIDSGFPVDVPGAGMETATIARDSTGTLWLTYTASSTVFVAHTTGGSDTTWGAPFIPSVGGATSVTSDDISSVIAFTDNTGPAVGVMWSNQDASANYFAVHRDGQPDSSWTLETALSGTKESDDHINLKTVEGRVYAAVKTSQTKNNNVLIRLLLRSTSGSWSKHPVALVKDGNTRPITMLQLDPAARRVYIFMTIGEGTSARGIEYRSSPMDGGIAFGSATAFIQGANNETINDATSMKANADAASGIVVLASDGTRYWWNKLGGNSGSNQPPTANAGAASTNEDTATTVTLSGSDAETCNLTFSIVSAPTHGSLGSIVNQNCVAGSPNTDSAQVSYTPALNYNGPDSFTFKVNDGVVDSAAATVSLTVNPVNDVPVANAGSKSTAQNTPTTITLTGGDVETCDLTFSFVSSPAHGSLGSITNLACAGSGPFTDSATVQYTPTNSYSGPDMFSFKVNDGTIDSPPATISITVTASQPAQITFRSASSGANNGSATTVVIPAPSGVLSGDVMIASVAARGNPNFTAPAGWTLIRLDINGFTLRQALYWKVATGSEPPSYTWTLSNSQAAAGGIVAYSGVDTTNPIDVHSGAFSPSGATSSAVAPSVTTTVNGAMIVGFFGVARNTGVTPPAGMTERFDVVANGGTYPQAVESADVLQAAAGATGDKIATYSGTAQNVAQLLALRPMSGPGPPPNSPPAASAGSASTAVNTPVIVALSGSDLETCELTFSIVSPPTKGSLGSITNQGCSAGSPNSDSAQVTYTPSSGYSGPDSFTFKVNDGTADSTAETVSLTVVATNTPPTANGGSATTTQNTPVTVNLSGSDSETCELIFSIVTGPSHGSLGAIGGQACAAGSPNTDGAQVQYTPAGGYTGPDFFTYKTNDGTTDSSAATINIAVNATGSGIAPRAASQGVNSGSATSLVIPAPAGIQAGDVLIACVAARGNPNFTAPAGWTLIRLDVNGFTLRQALYWKVATGAEPAEYTWTLSNTQAAAGGIMAYTGVSNSNPIDQSSGLISSGTDATGTAPSVTTTVNGAMVIAFFGVARNSPIDAPSGMTERVDAVSNGGTYPQATEASDVSQSTSGATGDKTATWSGNGQWIGQQLALRPA